MTRLTFTAVLVLGLLGLIGCADSPPAMSSPEEGKQMLVGFLDAWKAGQSRDDYLQANPGLVISEPKWDGKTKLQGYEFTQPHKQSGFDVLFQLKLSVQTGSKATQERAYYAISTTPKKVIVRTEP